MASCDTLVFVFLLTKKLKTPCQKKNEKLKESYLCMELNTMVYLEAKE